MSGRVRSWIGDVRTWIILLAAVRLIGITDPPADRAHNWRQSTVLMVARNYHEQGIDLLHPRIDFAGEKSGITGMEFPALNAAVAAVSKVFGWHDWYGRVLVLLSCMLGPWCFHRLVRSWMDPRTAFIATLLLMTSLWFQYGRKTMPDIPALALVLFGLFGFQKWLQGRSGAWALVGWCSIALGVLCKSPAALLLVGSVPMCWSRRSEARTRIVAALALSALVPAVWWYGTWVPHLNATYGFEHFFMGHTMTDGARELLQRWPEVAEKFHFDALRFTGFAAFIAGLATILWKRAWGLLAVVALAFAGFLVLMLKAGGTFAQHSYYILPIVPVMAVVAAHASVRLPAKWAYLLAAVIALEGLANGQHDLFLPDRQRDQLLAIEPLLDRVSDRGDRIVINSGEVPTAMYFAHRKGWLAFNHQLQQASFRDSLADLGCRFVLVQRTREQGDVQLPLEELFVTDDLRVLRLR